MAQKGSHFNMGPHSHVHQPEPGALVKVHVAAEVKRRGVQEVFKPAAAIVQEALTTHSSSACLLAKTHQHGESGQQAQAEGKA